VSTSPRALQVLSTRLFPKNQGAHAYRLTGIAARCDWVVLSDTNAPKVTVVKRAGANAPRHVFISLRAPFDALAYFMDDVLPTIEGPFVLVSGSEDVTLPNQLDCRWRGFTAEESGRIAALLDDPRLVRWFAENLDDRSHPKFLPLPLGMVFPDSAHSHSVGVPVVTPLEQRPLRILCAHRVREGPQWDTRRKVTKLCRDELADFCTVLEEDVPEEAYVKLLESHAFVICAQGGGIDPSPKAWQCVLHGAVPIVQSTALDPAYDRLPVAYVPEWTAPALQPAILRNWLAERAPAFDVAANREAVLERLGIDYWWALIEGEFDIASRQHELGRRQE
jgi:hypothetical protein